MDKRNKPRRSEPPAPQCEPPAAAAVRYDPEREAAPRVMAAGRGDFARRIVEAARAAGVPVVPDPELARSLSRLEGGEVIPPELYQAVAQVLAFLSRLDEKAKARWLGEGRP